MNMKIMITGSNGLLGQKLVYALKNQPGIHLVATARGENRMRDKHGYVFESLDVTDEKQVMDLVIEHYPDCIINTAAMTNVDECEKDKEGCVKLNIDAVRYLVNACKLYNTHLIHLSTDFVFDGTDGQYKEEDMPNPQSYYAWSKLESEKLLEQSNIDWAILRTIIIYGVVDDLQRSNIVLWTKSSLEQHKTINVISDQFRSPTLAEDLAAACTSAASKRAKGIYHICGLEFMSILDIAYTVADYFKLDKQYIQPITTAELNQAAARPLRTGFVIDKAKQELDYLPHTLLEGLEIVAEQLKLKEELNKQPN